MSASEDESKPHEPTQHKLDEARRKGEIARSADLTTAAAYAGFLLAGLIGAESLHRTGGKLMILLDQAGPLAEQIFIGPARGITGGLMASLAAALLIWITVPPLCALLAILAQRGFVMAPGKLAPRFSRIDPLRNARNKYGPGGLFEFAKSLAKLLLYSISLGLFLILNFAAVAETAMADPGGLALRLLNLLSGFMFVVVMIATAIGAVDYIWQRFDHRRRNRMSHREVQEEHRQHEGDPHMKQQRRQRGMEIASGRMLEEVPAADVVIVNPTHFAVALKWDRARDSAPVCVAKGADHVAAAIREAAQTHGVPVHHDPPTARTLHAVLRIGDEIAPEFYQAVAAAIRFADRMRRRARGIA